MFTGGKSNILENRFSGSHSHSHGTY